MRGGRGRPHRSRGEVEVVAHLQLGVVAGVYRALRQAAPQRRRAGARQVVGMDVVGVDVFVRVRAPACRAPGARAGAARAVGRVDARDAQDASRAHRSARPYQRRRCSASTRRRARSVCGSRRRVSSKRAPRNRHTRRSCCIDDALHAPPAGQRAQQVRGAQIARALRRRRREVQHARRPGPRAAASVGGRSRSPISGVTPAARKLAHALGARGQRQQSLAAARAARAHAHADVAATDDQQRRALEARAVTATRSMSGCGAAGSRGLSSIAGQSRSSS